MLTWKKDAAKTLRNAHGRQDEQADEQEKRQHVRMDWLSVCNFVWILSVLGPDRSESDCAVSRNGASFLTS